MADGPHVEPRVLETLWFNTLDPEQSLLKLQNKILLLLVPLTVVPLLMLGWFAYSQLFETAKERTFGQMTTLLHQVHLRTESQIRTARANAILFASG
ncbi:MAG: hypothetical protein V3S33_02025, partial [Gammaproteobacteria bacterium]